MTQVVQLKGDMIAQLSKLVKRVGEQQKDLILEFSQQLSQHNELIEKALEKQERMEGKINRIEAKLMEKEIYHYQLIQDKLEQKKQEENQRRQQEREYKRKLSEQQEKQKIEELQNQMDLAGDNEDEGFASCEEDEKNNKKDHKVDGQEDEEEKTGDPIKDFYLGLKNVKNKEDKKYIRQGKQGMYELLEWMKPEVWVFEKSHHQCDIYNKRDGHNNLVVYKIETKFDYPPELVFEYFSDGDKRMQWDGTNYETLKAVKAYEMNTNIAYVRLKQQWPLGNRDLLLLFQVIQKPNGDIFMMSKATKHDDIPEQDKIIRIDTRIGSIVFTAMNDRKTTHFQYIAEFDFKGSMPRYMIHKASQASYIDSLNKLKKLLDKVAIDKKYKPPQ